MVLTLCRAFSTHRQENEAIVQLKQLTASHKVPFGLLRKGSKAIKDGLWLFNVFLQLLDPDHVVRSVLTNFDTAKQADMENEKRPEAERKAAKEKAEKKVASFRKAATPATPKK